MAGITPDPKERGYLLPPGCKDLYDVLQQEKQRAINPAASSKGWTHYSDSDPGPLQEDEDERVFGQCQLHEIECYVVLLFEANKSTPDVTLLSRDPELTVHVRREADQTIRASVPIPMGTEQEKKAREFFTRQSWPLPEAGTWSPRRWPNVPVYQFYDTPSLPPTAPLAAKMVAAFFQEIAGLTGQSELAFHHMKWRTLPD